MGKKSLTKSTTKKKTQKNVKKKTVDTPAKSTEKKQPLSSALTAPLDKQFDSQIPKKPWKPKPDKTFEKNFAAPPFVEGKSKAAKQIRSLLTMTFDLDDAPAKPSEKKEPPREPKKSSAKADAPKQKKSAAETTAKPAKKPEKKAAPAKPKTETPASAEKADEKAAPKPKAAPKKTVSVKELLAMSFDSWQPETPFTPDAPLNNEAYFKAPPAFEGIDKGLILKEFDLSVPDTPKPSVAPEPETEKPEAPEPEIETTAPEAADTPAPETEEPSAPVETAAPVEAATPVETAKPETVPEAPGSVETSASGESDVTPEMKNEEAAETKPEAPKEATPPVEPEEKPPETPMPPQQDRPDDSAGDSAGDGGGVGGDGGGDGGGTPPQPPKKDPMISTGTKILIAAIAFIFLILIASSVANHNRWFIKDTREGVELWRGEFSPTSKHKVATLKNASAPDDIKPYYDRKEAMAIAYDHYIGNAREMMEKRDIPVDLQGIRANLENARDFAITESQKKSVSALLKQVDFTMLIYRADVASEKQSMEGYELALEYLNQAADMDMEAPGRRDMLRARIEYVEERIETLAAEKSESAKEATESKETKPDGGEPETPDMPQNPAEENTEAVQKPENNASSR